MTVQSIYNLKDLEDSIYKKGDSIAIPSNVYMDSSFIIKNTLIRVAKEIKGRYSKEEVFPEVLVFDMSFGFSRYVNLEDVLENYYGSQ